MMYLLSLMGKILTNRLMMDNALIGFSGFIGSVLLKQTHFSALYRSNNIHEIENNIFNIVVCAGAPAQKWIANLKPAEDKLKIDLLIDYLRTIKCKKFILISTVDVFKEPIDVDESTCIEEDGLHPYGQHRRMLEKFVARNFASHLIVRLPGIVGPGLRKNVIFDLLNNNNIEAIDSQGVFQFYPLVNLWYDIQTSLESQLSLVHLTTEPISVADVSLKGFGRLFTNKISNKPAYYDVQTCYAKLFGSIGRYQYNNRDMLQAIRYYAQSERITLKRSNRDI